MDDRRLTELLHLQSAGIAEQTTFCPEDRQIAEYCDGVLSVAERGRIERHVADCRHCAARIGMLARLEREEAAESRIPEDTLAAARLMGQPATRARGRLAAWAAAAVIVLAIGAHLQSTDTRRPGSNVGSPDSPPDRSGELRDTRSIDTRVLRPIITSPREGQPAGANSLISWTAVPGSLFYQVRVVSDAGDLLWQERVDDTGWRVPDSLGLAPGAEYFVCVDAYLTEAKSLQSEYLLFRFGSGD